MQNSVVIMTVRDEDVSRGAAGTRILNGENVAAVHTPPAVLRMGGRKQGTMDSRNPDS